MADIFISWSKDRSLLFAKALRQLMADVLIDPAVMPPGPPQAPGPFVPPSSPGESLVFLSQDLPKGGSWFQSLANTLENALAGIICVTPENRSSPWLLFEAGSLIRCDYTVALFPVLLDLPPTSLDGPLALLQATVIERDPEEIKRQTFELLQRVRDHVNQLRQDPGTPSHQQGPPITLTAPPPEPLAGAGAPVLDPWSLFATKVVQIQSASVTSIFDRFPQLFERKTFQEPLMDCADQRWLDRYAGARIARDEMERYKGRISAALPPGAQLAYDRLSSAVDSYAMAIGGLLIAEREFGRGTDGSLNDADGRLAVCERRRKAILAAYRRLRDPIPPVFDDARIYEELSDLEERKMRLIHPLEYRLDGPPADGAQPAVPDWQLARAATSPWLYDRLVCYLHTARAKDDGTFRGLMDGLERELALIEARDEPATLVGVFYALEAVERRGAAHADKARLQQLLDRIDARIEQWNRPPENGSAMRVDANRKLRRMVQRLRGAIDPTAGPAIAGDRD